MQMTPTSSSRPNIILILADDLGFSDVGCFGSEIRTPNIDRLAADGLRFTQMYNSARCCPSRAALLTGLNPHQAGVGHMVSDLGVASYQGYLSESCVTIAEVLGADGYRTLMSGKWHVGGQYSGDAVAGDAGYPTPTQRGFDRYFGMLGGGGSYFNSPTLMRHDTSISVESTDFYLTDAISDEAVGMIQDAAPTGEPFFLYVGYTAPHWPLHALEVDIAKYLGSYRGGWDRLRTGRHEQLKGMGLVDSKWEITPRDTDAPPWGDIELKDWEDLRMAVYAAQIDRMDQGIGRIMAKVRELGVEQDTLVMFLADNGGCAEFLQEDPGSSEVSLYAAPTVDGRPIRLGNDPAIRPGPADTFMSYDLPWANASNAPFRRYKHWVHEGGISTPFVMHWPARIKEGAVVQEPAYLVDITATCIDAASAPYPKEFHGNPITPLEGESLMPAVEGQGWTRAQPIIWEHEGNRAVRLGQWKLVSEYPGPWELYDMIEDRTELNDLAGGDGQRVAEMAKLYNEWAERCGVVQWPVIPEQADPLMRGERAHTARFGTNPAGLHG